MTQGATQTKTWPNRSRTPQRKPAIAPPGRVEKKEEDSYSSSVVRLQKYLSECGVASRRASEEMIQEGRVKVNGKVVTTLGTKIDPSFDRIQIGTLLLKPPQKGVILLNKPRGVVSTMSDPEGRPSLAEFITKPYRSYFPVGRLDWESSGLIILTNDGEMAERLMHPRYELDRIYHARVEGSVSEKTFEKLGTGVKLRDGMASAQVKHLKHDEETTWVEVVIHEGRNRIVRRLMEEVGHSVIKLKRVSHGPFQVGKLKPGQLRKLTEREYKLLRGMVMKMSEKPKEREQQIAKKKDAR